jgi:ribosome-interacting GTPase 1
MVLDATKPWYHREILTRELESVGMRLNRCGDRCGLNRARV